MRKSPIYVASIVAGLLLMVLSVVPMFSQETNAGETFAEQFYEKETSAQDKIEPQNAEKAAEGDAQGFTIGMARAILGASLAAAGGGFGSSVGVGIAGEVGNGVLSEDDKKFAPVLILQALPATQSIYGMLTAFIIMQKITIGLSFEKGLNLLCAAVVVAVVQLISAIWQGKVSAASMQLIARKPKQMGQAIILPAMVETFAVFGLLVGIILIGIVK